MEETTTIVISKEMRSLLKEFSKETGLKMYVLADKVVSEGVKKMRQEEEKGEKR